ncbi:glutathione S-transferase [Acinetobacter sp.]|uniref:glutathione S-transferase n=1 Tax=Acinetobacter sp. TaxID=472 RepID=UPI0026470428|nr:glutathione S-transferase [Acinetobacter sp.]MDN5511857.1 glutathione S-transferase [Acinetobacter sp.]MDN5524702.1 glutathione S-transferase [Acinetobacter sp.]
MITLHHLDQSRSFRILWALEELAQDYQVKFYKRLPTLAAPPELKLVHPLAKAPILTDEDQTIVESAVILQHLQESYDTAQKFKPKAKKDQQQYRYWMHYAEGSLMPLLLMQLVMNNVPKHVPWLIKPVAHKITSGVKAGFIHSRLKDHIAYLEDYLSKHEYFAGSFSFADIQMWFPLDAIQSRTSGSYPHIAQYLKRLEERPAFQRARFKEQGLT